MRPLTEEETKVLFQKSAEYIGRSIEKLIDRSLLLIALSSLLMFDYISVQKQILQTFSRSPDSESVCCCPTSHTLKDMTYINKNSFSALSFQNYPTITILRSGKTGEKTAKWNADARLKWPRTRIVNFLLVSLSSKHACALETIQGRESYISR